jgi:hypothetical protein
LRTREFEVHWRVVSRRCAVKKWRWISVALWAFTPTIAFAAEPANVTVTSGVGGIWVLANFSYAGMRAQNSASSGWRVVSFIFGFPGTLVSYLAIPEGGERAYGVDVPRRRASGE